MTVFPVKCFKLFQITLKSNFRRVTYNGNLRDFTFLRDNLEHKILSLKNASCRLLKTVNSYHHLFYKIITYMQRPTIHFIVS